MAEHDRQLRFVIEQQRHENDQSCGGGRDDGYAHLARAEPRGSHGRLASLQSLEDGLQHDDGVVDQHARSQHQAHHRNDVQGVTVEVEQTHGREHREWDCQTDRETRVQSPQEREEHDYGKHGAVESGLEQFSESILDRFAGIVPPACRESVHGRVLSPPLEGRLDLVDHIYGVRLRGLLDGQSYRVGSILVSPRIAQALVEHHVGHIGEHKVLVSYGKVRDCVD